MTSRTVPPRQDSDPYHAPQGTLALLLVYLALIVAGWFCVYLLLISRGAVQ